MHELSTAGQFRVLKFLVCMCPHVDSSPPRPMTEYCSQYQMLHVHDESVRRFFTNACDRIFILEYDMHSGRSQQIWMNFCLQPRKFGRHALNLFFLIS